MSSGAAAYHVESGPGIATKSTEEAWRIFRSIEAKQPRLSSDRNLGK